MSHTVPPNWEGLNTPGDGVWTALLIAFAAASETARCLELCGRMMFNLFWQKI